MVFSSGQAEPETSPRSFYHRMSFGCKKNTASPRSGTKTAKDRRHEFGSWRKEPGSFAEDIWDFDDSWFASTRNRSSRLDFFGELLWELVRLQSLLDYLLRPTPTLFATSLSDHRRSMSPGDDDYRRSRKRSDVTASQARHKPRARSIHGAAPRATFDDDEDEWVHRHANDYDHRRRHGNGSSRTHRHRDSSTSAARLSSKDGDNVSRASAPASSDDAKEESSKGWRTLTKELRKLLSSKFNDKDDHDDDSSTTDTSPRSVSNFFFYCYSFPLPFFFFYHRL
jgi:hypothetical protein